MPSPVLIAIDASPASAALLALARRYCRPGEHELHVLLAIDSTFAVHEQPAPYTAEELEEYPAACMEQQHADHAVAKAVRELQQAGFASQGCMVAGLPVEAIVALSRVNPLLRWSTRRGRPSPPKYIKDSACPAPS